MFQRRCTIGISLALILIAFAVGTRLSFHDSGVNNVKKIEDVNRISFRFIGVFNAQWNG